MAELLAYLHSYMRAQQVSIQVCISPHFGVIYERLPSANENVLFIKDTLTQCRNPCKAKRAERLHGRSPRHPLRLPAQSMVTVQCDAAIQEWTEHDAMDEIDIQLKGGGYMKTKKQPAAPAADLAAAAGKLLALAEAFNPAFPMAPGFAAEWRDCLANARTALATIKTTSRLRGQSGGKNFVQRPPPWAPG